VRTMPRLYAYVGPDSIRARLNGKPAGTRIHSATDLLDWIRRSERDGDYIVATFVIDSTGDLLLAERRSEHVACAGGDAVLSAGEMFFCLEGSAVGVAEVSNQSTGYCPEPESWRVVAAALERIGVPPPSGFTRAIVFRRCEKCEERSIVKDGWFVCGVCGAELPETWNF
jgi:hypothetical protein